MLEKLSILLLISLIHSEKLNLNVTLINNYEPIQINDQEHGLICVELNEELKKGKNIYIIISNTEKDQTINKNIYYNITGTSCKNNNNNIDIDFDNLDKEFLNSINEPDFGDNKEGFHYQYKLEKTDENQKYLLFLFTNFTGTELTIQYSPIDVADVLKIFLIIISSIIFVVAVLIVLCFYLCKKRGGQERGFSQSNNNLESMISK